MGNGASGRMHFYSWGEFAINFLRNYTVKILKNNNTVIVRMTVNRNKLTE